MQDVGILQLVDNHFVFSKRDVTKPFPNDHTELREDTGGDIHVCQAPSSGVELQTVRSQLE